MQSHSVTYLWDGVELVIVSQGKTIQLRLTTDEFVGLRHVLAASPDTAHGNLE